MHKHPQFITKNGSSLPPRESCSRLKNMSFICFLSPYTAHTCCVLFNSCGGKCLQNNAWLRPEIQFAQTQGQGQAGSVSYPSKFSIALHGNARRERRREKTIGLCDPRGERQLRVRDCTRPALKHSTVTSPPCRQISVRLPLTRTVSASRDRPALFRLDFCVN